MAGYGLVLLREILAAQLLAVPFALALLVHFMPRARALASTVPRLLATFACVLLATPAGVAIAVKQIGGLTLSPNHFVRPARQAATGLAPCDFATLHRLGEGVVFTSPNSLARALLLGKPASWLDPVAGFEDTQLRVFKIN